VVGLTRAIFSAPCSLPTTPNFPTSSPHELSL
jgi:hypothetical protein